MVPSFQIRPTNCFFYSIPADQLENQHRILHSLQIEDIDSYASLFKLKMKEFYKIEKIWLADTENHGKNRIAYFSEQLDVRSLYKIF